MTTNRSKALGAVLLSFTSFAALWAVERSAHAQSAPPQAAATPEQTAAEARAASIRALAASAEALSALAKAAAASLPAPGAAPTAAQSDAAAAVAKAAIAAAPKAASALASSGAALLNASRGSVAAPAAAPAPAPVAAVSPPAAVAAAPAAAPAPAPVTAVSAPAPAAAPAAAPGPGAAASAPVAASPVAAAAPAAPTPPHWSTLPIVAPAAPQVAQKDWVRNPIDAFVLARIEAKGLKPSPEADRAAYIRRATLDVWGLLPSPEETAAFVNDASPDAYEKLADRLLASPHYGERQARRWLDLARYADSAGFQGDASRENYYRYRDYVIGAFNSDKPYDLFIKEQIAGDELFPGDQNAHIATGFLTGYPDNPNSRDLVERKFQITTDMVDTVGSSILGSTVGCARCHNHKTDKFTMKDYYSLQAFFANTSTTEDFPVAQKTQAEDNYLKALQKYADTVKEIQDRRATLLAPVKEAAFTYHKERYLTDSREAIFKPEKDWNPRDRWVNHRLVNKNVTNDDIIGGAYLRYVAEDKEAPGFGPEAKARWDEYQKLTVDLRKFDNQKPVRGSVTFTGVEELGHADAPPTFIFSGGNHERPTDEVQPAFPGNLTEQLPVITPTATSSGRRSALANWIASRENPLTSRVYANRVWSQYFSTGIVRTVNDFGKAGDRPTNQELLDYLADNFAQKGWSVKQLHRQILLSSTYRQSSDVRPEVAKADPENKLLAVFPRQRLEAEEIRDALLVASGKLEDRVGGPSVFPPVPSNLGAAPAAWTVSKNQKDWYRRSLYIFTRRSVPYPLLEAFNAPNTQQVHATREVTTTPLQALTLINDEQVFQLSQAIAGRVIHEAEADENAEFTRLFQILFSRNPDDYEKAALARFLDDHQKVLTRRILDGKFTLAEPIALKDDELSNPIRQAAFVDLVHTVVNSNDFVYRF
jgi:hypothetical protein